MAIYWTDPPSDDERREVATWHKAAGREVSNIVIARQIVSVSGDRDRATSVTGTCARTGDLTADLTAALADMRKLGAGL